MATSPPVLPQGPARRRSSGAAPGAWGSFAFRGPRRRRAPAQVEDHDPPHQRGELVTGHADRLADGAQAARDLDPERDDAGVRGIDREGRGIRSQRRLQVRVALGSHASPRIEERRRTCLYRLFPHQPASCWARRIVGTRAGIPNAQRGPSVQANRGLVSYRRLPLRTVGAERRAPDPRGPRHTGAAAGSPRHATSRGDHCPSLMLHGGGAVDL